VIKIEGAGKERKRLTRAVVLAIRELMQQTEPDSKTRDLAAFIALALLAIDETIDESVTPWEKRGYWLKSRPLPPRMGLGKAPGRGIAQGAYLGGLGHNRRDRSSGS
jgi:hypothetical protein